ncbi:sugar ABC transporter permease, partial [Streptomyces sp. NPDC056244]
MAVVTAPPGKTRQRAAGRTPARKRATRVPPLVLAFVLVPLLIETFWVFWPAVQGFYLAFTQWDGVSAPKFIGLANFREMFGDEIFRTAALDTVIWLVLFGGLSVVLGLGAGRRGQPGGRGGGVVRAARVVAGVLLWGGEAPG